jgi:hypothetical protein
VCIQTIQRDPDLQVPLPRPPNQDNHTTESHPAAAETPESPPLWPSDEDDSDNRENVWDGSGKEQHSLPENDGSQWTDEGISACKMATTDGAGRLDLENLHFALVER